MTEINIVHNWKDCDGIGYSKDNIQKIALWIDKEMHLGNGTGIVLVIFCCGGKITIIKNKFQKALILIYYSRGNAHDGGEVRCQVIRAGAERSHP